MQPDLWYIVISIVLCTSPSALSSVHHHQHCLVYIISALSCVHYISIVLCTLYQHCLLYIISALSCVHYISIVLCTLYQHCLLYITISIVFCTSYQHCVVYIISALSCVHHHQHCLEKRLDCCVGAQGERPSFVFVASQYVVCFIVSPVCGDTDPMSSRAANGLTQALLGKVKTPVWNAYRFVNNNYSTPETNN